MQQKTSLPWYEYLITLAWCVILGAVGVIKYFEWETAAWVVLAILVIFTIGIFMYRRQQWLHEEWDGVVQGKRQRPISLIPFMKSRNELQVRTADAVIYPCVSRAIYGSVNPDEHLVKKAGDQNVTILES